MTDAMLPCTAVLLRVPSIEFYIAVTNSSPWHSVAIFNNVTQQVAKSNYANRWGGSETR